MEGPSQKQTHSPGLAESFAFSFLKMMSFLAFKIHYWSLLETYKIQICRWIWNSGTIHKPQIISVYVFYVFLSFLYVYRFFNKFNCILRIFSHVDISHVSISFFKLLPYAFSITLFHYNFLKHSANCNWKDKWMHSHFVIFSRLFFVYFFFLDECWVHVAGIWNRIWLNTKVNPER